MNLWEILTETEAHPVGGVLADVILVEEAEAVALVEEAIVDHGRCLSLPAVIVKKNVRCLLGPQTVSLYIAVTVLRK